MEVTRYVLKKSVGEVCVLHWPVWNCIISLVKGCRIKLSQSFVDTKTVFNIQKNPGNSSSDNSNSPANSNWVSIPSDLTQLFSHFYLVNSNPDNSKTLLTRTKFRFPWSKFTPITRISGSCNSPRIPIEISHQLFLSCDRILTLEQSLEQFDFN